MASDATGRILLIGAFAFCAGFAPGQTAPPANAEPSLPTATSPVPSVSVPVPIPSLPVPTVSAPVPPPVPTPTVPTVPTSPPSPPPASGPAPGGEQRVAETGGHSQTPAGPGTAVRRSQSTATRLPNATRRGGRPRSGSGDRRHAAAHRSGAAARRGELAAATAHRPSSQARAPASPRTSSSRVRPSHDGSSDPLGAL